MAQKVEAQRGVEGDVWDDGFYDGVRKVHVGQGQDGVSFINAVYEKGSQEVEGGEHGNTTLLGFETFEVDADDYIIKQWRSHSVTYDIIFGHESDVITSITFYTFKGKPLHPID
ncbi:unnamed protein product [Brassica rapa]|uniref:Jacalin-type lectin domain-containing protein n=1 Tax=Brassica campestris TaxID=3711 RepID=A0A8D9LXB8_BRACM|nr:unnamed protein product [Brassica rapa]